MGFESAHRESSNRTPSRNELLATRKELQERIADLEKAIRDGDAQFEYATATDDEKLVRARVQADILREIGTYRKEIFAINDALDALVEDIIDSPNEVPVPQPEPSPTAFSENYEKWSDPQYHNGRPERP